MALPLLEQAAALAPEMASVHVQLGRALNNLRRLPAAHSAFEEAVRLEPGSADAWNGLGHVRRGLGDLEGAAGAFRKAVSIDPASARALGNLASVEISRGEVESGLAMLRDAAAVDPANPGVRCLLGDALQGTGRQDEAEAAYGEALSIDPDHADALTGLGAVMDAMGRYERAERLLRRALERKPGDPVAAASLTHVLELQGRSEEVLTLLRGFGWSRVPDWAVVSEARQLFALDRREEAEARLDNVDPSGMDPAIRAAALNLHGRISEAGGDYEAAFGAFQAANHAQPVDFDPEGYRDTVHRLIGFFTPERLRALPGSGCESDRPVFIVGMPRSGTSLVEQILGSHSRVHACGERTDFYQLPRRLSGGPAATRWPECLESTDVAELSRVAFEYLDGDGTDGTSALRSIDKLPANFLNLGLVQLLFPGAHVIHCIRDPMDTGLSCFQQDFQSPGMGFTRDLSCIGLYYQGYRRLMEHWQRVLDLPIHKVAYEDLVSEPEAGARAMLEFLDLEWEDACLRFHESRRVVRTASHLQVRQPVYESSVGRWRRYSRWLGPLKAALDVPWQEGTAPPGQ